MSFREYMKIGTLDVDNINLAGALTGGHIGSIPTVGNVFYVDDATGANAVGSEAGKVNTPFATIDYAINQCTADKGDVIWVFPKHEESVTATSIVMDTDGISIIGMGIGHGRPKLTFAATSSNIVWAGNECMFQNMVFMAGVSAVVSAMTITGDSNCLVGCEWNFSTTDFDFVIMADFDTADDCYFMNNKCLAEAAAGSNEAVRIDQSDNLKITGNWFDGDFTTAVIAGIGAASTGGLIANNFIRNSDDGASSMTIDAHDDSTGLIANNMIGTLHDANPEDAFDPGDMLCVQNYVCNDENESGALVPVAVST